ncbi:hypothetical protein J0910_01175 [Nocardiopsis sp. CNT-189]|uniref:hypothetical protein n=1 Tax=Nocardiopsis oceanisediminis TaxID=2816862 RepID=UPI003B2CA186
MVEKARPLEAPARQRVDTLGGCRVDGLPVSSARAVELAVALAVSGGAAPRDWLLSVLFDTDPAPSSLPTLAMRARALDLAVGYLPDRHSYALLAPIECDLVEFFREMKSGDPRRALSLYRGPFMPRSHSPFASGMRSTIESLVGTAAQNGDTAFLAEADRLIKHPDLSRRIVSAGADPLAVSLSRTWLRTLESA